MRYVGIHRSPFGCDEPEIVAALVIASSCIILDWKKTGLSPGFRLFLGFHFLAISLAKIRCVSPREACLLNDFSDCPVSSYRVLSLCPVTSVYSFFCGPMHLLEMCFNPSLIYCVKKLWRSMKKELLPGLFCFHSKGCCSKSRHANLHCSGHPFQTAAKKKIHK